MSDPWFEVYKPAPGVFAIYEPHQAEEVISYLIVGEKRGKDIPQSVPRAPQALVTGLHGGPFHADRVCDVLLHAVSDETPFLRGQRVRKEQRLAQSQGLLSHRGAGALEVRPDIDGEEPDQQAEDHGERR